MWCWAAWSETSKTKARHNRVSFVSRFEITLRTVKFSRTEFIIYFSGRSFSLWIKFFMYSHISLRDNLYMYRPDVEEEVDPVDELDEDDRGPMNFGKSITCEGNSCQSLVLLFSYKMENRQSGQKSWTHLNLLNDLFTEWANFSWTGQNHVFLWLEMTIDTIKLSGTHHHLIGDR